MGTSVVVKDPKRGPVWSLSVLAAGVVAVGAFLWLTPADSNEHAVTPTAQPAALALSAPASTAADIASYCGSSENGPVEVDYERLDMRGIERTPVDLALAQGQGGADYSVVSVSDDLASMIR
jgi:hypothetical protein